MVDLVNVYIIISISNSLDSGLLQVILQSNTVQCTFNAETPRHQSSRHNLQNREKETHPPTHNIIDYSRS